MQISPGLKEWIKKKGETAEEWLPWAIAVGTTLALAVVFFVRIFSGSSDRPRNPAGFVEVSDSDVPAKSIYSEVSIDDVGSSGKRQARSQSRATRASGHSTSAKGEADFAVAISNGPSKNEIEKRTGISGKRARAVILVTTKLVYRTPGREMALPLELFEDTKPVVVLKVMSGHDVNTGIHTGQIPDDPNSKVQLTTADGSISGFVRYQGREFRIVADPETGLHYIIELSAPTGL